MRILVAVAIFTVLCPGGTVLSQTRPDDTNHGYREGTPATNSKPMEIDPGAASAQIRENFHHWYLAQHRPAMLIFWNRELTDETTSRFAGTVQTHSESHTAVWSDGRAEHATHSSDGSAEISQRPVTGGSYADLDPGLAERVETAFQATLLDDGVELVDRNTIIRKMSTRASREDRGDLQLLEAVSLGQGVRYLVEVLPTQRADSPTGIVFKVRIKHLSSATLVAQFLTPALPPAGPAHWVTTSNGFAKRSDSRTTPETIGEELALEVMRHLM